MVIQFSSRGLMTVIFRHKIKIALTFLLCVVGAIAYATMAKPIYETRASLLVKFGRQADYRPEDALAGPSVPLDRKEILNSHVRIMESRDLLETVLGAIGTKNLYPDIADNPALSQSERTNLAVQRFGDNLNAHALRESNVIELAFRDPDPEIATRAASILVDRFIDQQLRLFSDPQSGFMQQQVDVFRGQLTDAQEAVKAFKREHGISSLEEERTMLLQQRLAVDVTLKSGEARIAELERKAEVLGAGLQKISPEIELFRDTNPDRSIEEAKSKLMELSVRETQVLQTYRPDSPQAQAVRGEIATVRAAIAKGPVLSSQSVRTGRNQAYQDLSADALRTNAELGAQRASTELLRRQVTELDQRVQGLDRQQTALQDLMRQQQIAEVNYRTYLQRSEDARINDDLNRARITSISVIEKAQVPIRPVRPRKLAAVALGVALGLVLGLGIAFVFELLDDGFSMPVQIERAVGLPVLAAIGLSDRRPARLAIAGKVEI